MPDDKQELRWRVQRYALLRGERAFADIFGGALGLIPLPAAGRNPFLLLTKFGGKGILALFPERPSFRMLVPLGPGVGDAADVLEGFFLDFPIDALENALKKAIDLAAWLQSGTQASEQGDIIVWSPGMGRDP